MGFRDGKVSNMGSKNIKDRFCKDLPYRKNLGLPWFSMVLNVFHWFSIGLSGPLVPQRHEAFRPRIPSSRPRWPWPSGLRSSLRGSPWPPKKCWSKYIIYIYTYDVYIYIWCIYQVYMMDIWYCIYYIIKLYTYMDGGSENDRSQSHHGFKYSNEDARKCFLCLKLSISEILNESWAIASISLWYSLSLFAFIQWWNKWSQAESLQLVLMATVHGGSSTLLFYQDEPLLPETFRRWACRFTRQNNQHVPVLPPDLSPDCNFLGLHFCDLNIFEYQYRVDIQDV